MRATWRSQAGAKMATEDDDVDDDRGDDDQNGAASEASCRAKRVDDHSRFHANFRDFRGARVATLTRHILKPNADPVVLT